MDTPQYLKVKEAAQLEGLKVKTLLRRGERRGLFLPRDSDDARRKLYPISALSRKAYQAYLKSQVSGALQGFNGQSQLAPTGEQQPEQAITPCPPWRAASVAPGVRPTHRGGTDAR